MKKLELNIPKIMAVTAMIELFIVELCWWYWGEAPLSISLQIRNSLSVITVLIPAFYWLFNEYLWKIIPEQLRTPLGIPPNLNGRWKGYVLKGYKRKILFVIEIKQTLSNLSYKTYTKKSGGLSSGSSLDASIYADGDVHKIITAWCNDHSLPDLTQENENQREYKGLSRWSIAGYKNDSPGTLNYSYFTSRKTEGQACLEFESRQLEGSFGKKIKTHRAYSMKININLALGYEVEQFCKSVNDAMVKEGLDDINFDNNHVPHITLLMGNIRSEDDYLKIVQFCENLANLSSGIKYQISSPYWKQPSEKFVFVDVLQPQRIDRLRSSLDANIKELIEYTSNGGLENLTHITLGYSDFGSQNNDIFSSLPNPPSGVADSIRICKAGSHGTCNEILNEFRLLSSI